MEENGESGKQGGMKKEVGGIIISTKVYHRK